MSGKAPETNGDFEEQAAQRAAMRRDIHRANTEMAAVVLGALALALVAVFAGLRATHNLQRAESAETEGQERLHKAYIAEAHALRADADPGGRIAALTAISNAVAIHPSQELRTEATACLALSDLIDDGPLLPPSRHLIQFVMDARLKYYVFGETNGSVSVYSLRDGSLAKTLRAAQLGPGTARNVVELSFSPDSRYLAGRMHGGAVVVWDINTEQPVLSHDVSGTNASLTLPQIVTLSGLSFSPDSRFLYFGDGEENGQISTYEISTGQRIVSGIAALGKVYRMRPGAKQVAVAMDNSVDLLEYPGGRQIDTLQHQSRVELMDWSDDGRKLAIAAEDGSVTLWDPARSTHWHLGAHSERCVRLGFSPDGSKLFSASRDGTTFLWDTTLGQLIASGSGLGGVFTPDGQRIGFWRPWTGFGSWKILPEESYSVHPCDTDQGPLMGIDLSTKGRWCVVTQIKGLHLWDLANREDVFIAVPGVTCARFSPDEGVMFVCCARGLEVWPLDTNAGGIPSLPPASPQTVPLPDNAGARSIALSADGRWAAVELADLRLFRVSLPQSAAPVEIKGRWRMAYPKGSGSPTGAGRFVISPDGRWIATGFGFNDGDNPKIWDGNTGDLVQTLPIDTSLVQFSADGKWFGATGMDQRSIWSVDDWKVRWSLPRDEPAVTHGPLAFFADGATIATGRTRQTVELRNWQTGKKITDFIPPLPQSVNTVRVSQDGSTLVTATATDMIEVWRLKELRRGLAELGLDWGENDLTDYPQPGPPKGPTVWWATLAASLTAFALIAALGLLIVRRHRAAVERFVLAEAKTAQRNRELDNAKVELLQSQKMQALGTLAAGIAHDFNNLLSVVRMSNKLIARNANGDVEIKEHVEDIEQAVLQGKSVVGSMLGYSRRDDPNGPPTDVDAAVEDAVSLLSREFLSGIALTLELARGAPPVLLGRAALEQALLNLLVNASEAMAGQGRLKIAVRAIEALTPASYVLRPRVAPGYVELSVTDSGPGIAPEIRDRLFEPFFTTKRSGSKPGTGLGLSLVYSVAQQGGLGLSVDSAPGAGATFRLVLPAFCAPCAPDAQRQNAGLTVE